MLKTRLLLAATTALAIGGLTSVASAAPASAPLSDAGAAMRTEAGTNGLKQNVLFWGHRRWGYWGGPRVYSYYYGPRRWHHRRYWHRGYRRW
jgi:hypothetical protein